MTHSGGGPRRPCPGLTIPFGLIDISSMEVAKATKFAVYLTA